MSNANTQNRFKTILWLEVLIFFSPLAYKYFPEASRAGSASFFQPNLEAKVACVMR